MANYLNVPTASGASTPDQAGLAALILNEDFTTATLGNGPWTATSGETWSALGTASVLATVAARNRRFVDDAVWGCRVTAVAKLLTDSTMEK